MDKKFALKKAQQIAKFIKENEKGFLLAEMDDISSSAILLEKHETGIDTWDENFNPNLKPRLHISEILIFGSVARAGDHEVGDIDFMILDDGYFSSNFVSGCLTADWYDNLTENLEELIMYCLNCSFEETQEILKGIGTDLHVLPLDMLKVDPLRKEIAEKHHDPRFLQNAFSSLLRFDGNEFVPVDISYFEAKYGADLSDLKN